MENKVASQNFVHLVDLYTYWYVRFLIPAISIPLSTNTVTTCKPTTTNFKLQ